MSMNEQQELLINELEKNVILLASAGTGKTETLSKRVANIIDKGKAEPSQILCITFTNKACKEIRERIEGIVGASAKDITVKTFHSFCFDVIKQEAKKGTDVFTDFTIFDEEDCRELVKYCNYFDFSVSTLQKFIDTVKLTIAKNNIYSDDIMEDCSRAVSAVFKTNEDKINQICTEKGNLNYRLKEILRDKGSIFVNSYNSLLYHNHGLDFADLIIKAKELFNNPEVVNSYINRYKYINIDEVQDTSTLEYSIIEKLFKGNNVLICGDKFQTIYGWRGSEPNRIFKSFKENYDPKEIIFTINYRATKNLTEASLKYLENAFPIDMKDTYKEGIQCESKDAGDKISLKIADNLREEARFIYNEVINLERKNGSADNICVLTRDNRYNINLSEQLKSIMKPEAVNFEFILVDQFKFFRRQEIKDVIAFLKLIANRYDSISLKRIVKRLPTGVGDKTFEAIESEKYKKLGISLSDFIDDNVFKYGDKYSLLIDEFQKDNIIVFDVESTGVDVTEDEIIQIAAIKVNKNGQVTEKFERFLKNNKSVKNSEHVHGFSDEFLKKNGEDKNTVLKEFVKFSEDSVIVGHNVQYDINILTSELQRAGLGEPKFKAFYDTLDIYRRFHPNLRNHKLETLSHIFETENKPSHDAMDDIQATKDILVRAIKDDIVPTSMERIACMSKYLKAFNNIADKLNNLFKEAEGSRPHDIVNKIVNGFSLKTLYTGDEGKEKIERLRDFYVLLRELDNKNKNSRDSLLDIIRITSLSNGELESLVINRTKKPRIPIITVHQAKGLEYETVFISGAQQNTFPSYMSIKSNNLEEEKRTFYVAMTRAKKQLYITCNTDGRYKRTTKSEFIDLIPWSYISIV
ncbi:ATP-dependent DNA helicase [Clostridium carboxidivorans P7]|uniref:DNA 3'-5' helicase n=1 Tax=Clostridium carboxidivorans P7 TaxID=536227 RepID=C6PML3_9CLOT|nr:3'-5' exonuclease [Clostridium carboxidivorans]AKN29913.1 ATP-dependent DNA helicase [Clostridium carboxidivorans P7]EET89412.1 DNA polymerase III, epsilon subunit [Clostridium carboxidivorans P7]